MAENEKLLFCPFCKERFIYVDEKGNEKSFNNYEHLQGKIFHPKCYSYMKLKESE